MYVYIYIYMYIYIYIYIYVCIHNTYWVLSAAATRAHARAAVVWSNPRDLRRGLFHRG